MNVATTTILNTAATPKHSDDIETHIKSLEDKLLSKIAALKSYFFNGNIDLRNDIMLLKKIMKKKIWLIQIIERPSNVAQRNCPYLWINGLKF